MQPCAVAGNTVRDLHMCAKTDIVPGHPSSQIFPPHLPELLKHLYQLSRLLRLLEASH